MCDDPPREIVEKIDEAFDRAMDYAVKQGAQSREAFQHHMVPFLLGWLMQSHFISPSIHARFFYLSDSCGQLSLGKEVK